ncbi:MAG: translocation and assembly module TamB [Gammaproteobacteria bacterium]|jgi:translocation and assembly module TamB
MTIEDDAHDGPIAQKKKLPRKSKWRWLKAVLLAVVLLLLLLVTGLSWIIGTESGTRWSVNTAQKRLPALTIESPSGSFWHGVSADSLRWQQDELSILITEFNTRWRFDCLLDSVFCIDSIAAKSIDIQLSPADTGQVSAESNEPITLPALSLPVDIDLTRLKIESIKINLGDGSEAQWVSAIELSASTQQNHVTLNNLSLVYQQYRATINGGIELSNDYALDMLLTASATPLVVIDNQAHNQDIKLRLSGSLKNLVIDGSTRGLADFSLSATLKPLDKQLSYSAKVSWDRISWPPKKVPIQITSTKGEITATGNLQNYALTFKNSIEGDGIPASKIKLNGEGDSAQFQLANLLIETLGGKVNVNGKVNWLNGINWAANLNFDNINPSVQWPELPGDLNGALVANGLVEGDAISATLKKLAVDGCLLEYSLSLRASAEHAHDQTILLKSLTLEVDQKENDIKTSVPKTKIAIAGKGDYSHFDASNIKIETLDGEVNGKANVIWSDPASPGRIQWLTELMLSNINPGQHWPDFVGQLNGNLIVDGTSKGEVWALNVKQADIIGQLRQYPLALNTTLNRATDGQFTIHKFSLNSGDNQIKVTGSLGDEWSLDGDLTINQPEALLPDLSGTAKAKFVIHGVRKAPDIDFKLNAKSLLIADVSIDALDIEATIAALGDSDSQFKANAAGVKTNALTLSKVDVKLSGNRTDHQLALSTKGDVDAMAKLEGAFDDALNWLGALTSADISAYKQDWSLQKPTVVGWHNEDQSIDLAAHCWGQGSASACLDENATIAKSGNAKLSFRDFSLASLQAYFPKKAKFKGIVTGTGDLKWWADKQPHANVKLEVSDGGITISGDTATESVSLLYQTLSVDITADEKNVTAALRLNSSDIGNASANMTIDPAADNKIMIGNVSLQQLDLVTFKAFFPQLQTVRGTLSANGEISGRLSEPRYSGSADIVDLNIASIGLPISISDGFVRAKIDGTHANIDSGWQSGGTPVTLIGDADWQDLNAPTINLVLDGKRIEVRQAPTVIAKISPSIKLSIIGQDIKINGRVDIPYARVTIQELPPNATQISKDVVVIVEEAMVEGRVPTKDKKELRISTNVLVSFGKDARLEGFGLRASLTGDIGIKQTPGGILLLDGEVHIPDGIYKAYGQNLTVQRGRLLFVGPIDQTAIDIDAVRVVNSVTAGLKVRGSIKSPVVTLFSSPRQTEENTLSYIVFGKSIDTQSVGSEADILAKAALALGIEGGRGIATSISEQFGIQDFQIDTVSDGNESQVQLSGRLSPNLLLSYGVGVLTPVNTLKLRYNLTESFYVETAQSVESALDFFYTFDF